MSPGGSAPWPPPPCASPLSRKATRPLADRLGISDPASLIANGIFFRPIDPVRDEKYVKLFEEILAGF